MRRLFDPEEEKRIIGGRGIDAKGMWRHFFVNKNIGTKEAWYSWRREGFVARHIHKGWKSYSTYQTKWRKSKRRWKREREGDASKKWSRWPTPRYGYGGGKGWRGRQQETMGRFKVGQGEAMMQLSRQAVSDKANARRRHEMAEKRDGQWMNGCMMRCMAHYPLPVGDVMCCRIGRDEPLQKKQEMTIARK